MYNHHLPRRHGTSEPTIHFIFLLLKRKICIYITAVFVRRFDCDDFYYGIYMAYEGTT